MSGPIQVDTGEEAPTARRRSGPPPLLPVVVSLVLAVGGIFLRGGDGSGSGPAEVSPERTFPEFTVPEGEWEPLRFAGEGTLTAVVAGPDGLVAVGTSLRLDGRPFVFHTTDGIVWAEASGPWVEGETIVSVVSHRGRYLAAGYSLDASPGRIPSGGEPRLWVSGNGRTWGRLQPAGLPATGAITRLAADGDDLIALGWEGEAVVEPLFPPGPGSEGRIWESADGIVWTDATPSGMGWFTDVVTGALVAVAGTDGSDAVVWTGAGPGRWEAHRPPSIGVGPRVASVIAPAGDGLIVVVRSRDDPHGLPDSWRLRRSGTWTRIVPGTRPMDVGWAIALDGGYLAGPGFTRIVLSTGPELRASAEGVDWKGIEITSGPSPWPPALVTAAIRFEGRLLAVGSRGGEAAGWVLRGEDGGP